MTSNVRLEPTTVDYDAIFDALNEELSSKASWNSLRTAATGQALMRFMSAVGANAQLSVLRSTQERWFDTMRVPTSVVRGCRALGVHVQRRRPGSASCTVIRGGDTTVPLTIPAYTQWSVGGRLFFNRSDVVFPANVTTGQYTLYSGQVVSQSLTSDGSKFQRFVVGSQGFVVSDDDLWVITSNQRWSNTRRGLWRYGPTDYVFQDTTLPDGTVELWFGDGLFGALPPLGAVEARWVEVLDDSSVEVAAASVVTCPGYTGLQGYTNGASSANEDHRGADFYKIMGPKMRAGDESVVSRPDYRGHALKYPGVVDAKFRGEADVAPGDIRWMNILGATLVTTRAWTRVDWIKFVDYMTEAGISTTEIVEFAPKVVEIDVVLRVYVFRRVSDLRSFQDNLNDVVVPAVFAPKAGMLGAYYSPDDLSRACVRETLDEYGSTIDYIEVDSPEAGIRISPIGYVKARSISVSVSYTTRSDDVVSVGSIVGV